MGKRCDDIDSETIFLHRLDVVNRLVARLLRTPLALIAGIDVAVSSGVRTIIFVFGIVPRAPNLSGGLIQE